VISGFTRINYPTIHCEVRCLTMLTSYTGTCRDDDKTTDVPNMTGYPLAYGRLSC